MGLFSKRSKKGRKERVEPSLFAAKARGGPAKPKPPRRRRTLIGSMVRFGLLTSLWGTIGLVAMFSYIWFSLDQNGLLKIPDREPGVMVLAADGTALAQQGAFFGDDVRIGELPDYVPNAIIAIEDRRF